MVGEIEVSYSRSCPRPIAGPSCGRSAAVQRIAIGSVLLERPTAGTGLLNSGRAPFNLLRAADTISTFVWGGDDPPFVLVDVEDARRAASARARQVGAGPQTRFSVEPPRNRYHWDDTYY